MTALAYEVPEPVVVRTTGETHRDCEGEGCFDCQYLGSILVDYVACPEHGGAVARNAATGQLIGVCDGCAAEVARGLVFLSSYSTRVGGHILGDRAADARRDSL